jgi:cytoskeletal protein RodZ
MNKNAKAWIWVVAAVVAIIIIVLLVKHNNSATNQPNSTSNSQQTATSPATSTPPAATSSPTTKKGSSAYTKAVDTYQYRIQFTGCHGLINLPNSGTLSVAKGSKIMLDNRDPVAHTIAFKGVSVKVGAYNYAIVTASVVGNYPVTCDGGGSAYLSVN